MHLEFFLTIFSLLSSALAFSFDVEGTPTQCADITLTWTGGTAPFRILFTPVFGTPRNVSIPSSAFQDGKGKFSTQLLYASDQKFVISMSDAEGFGTGGTTAVLTTQGVDGASCNTTDPGVDFSYQLNSALQQCRPYVFSGYDGAVQPVTITGIIPGGQSFILNPPVGPTSYEWTANVWNQTSIIFVMEDSQGRAGGSSDLRAVSTSDDSSCIDGSSPSSTITAGPTSTSSSPSSESSTTADSSTPIGAIAGTVLGALVFLAASVTLGLFCLRKRRDAAHEKRYSHRVHSDVDLAGDPHRYPYPPNRSNDNGTSLSRMSSGDPFGSYGAVPAPGYAGYPESSVSGSAVVPFTAQSTAQGSMTAAERKAAMAGGSTYASSSRYIMHTDIEDAVPPPNDEGVIELPPQYSERRGPVSEYEPTVSNGSMLPSSANTEYPYTRPFNDRPES